MRKILPVLIVLVAIGARLLPGARTIDDAYITFRYARNILAGAGMVYNPGERVLGTTTPLYTGLMAGLGLFLGGENAAFPQIAVIANTFFDALTVLLLVRLGRRLNAALAGWGAALVWAVLPFSVTFAIGGLETSLYVLLLTATVYAYITHRHLPAALLAALSLLTRPDALILIGPLALDWVIGARGVRSRERGVGSKGQEVGSRERGAGIPQAPDTHPSTSGSLRSPAAQDAIPNPSTSLRASPHPSTASEFHSPSAQDAISNTQYPTSPHSPFTTLLAFLLPTVAWFGFASLYYGSPLPHSVTAKAVAYQIAPAAAFIRLLQHYATPFMGHLTFGVWWIAAGMVLYPFLFVAGARAALRETARIWPWLAYPWLYFATYAIANPLIFRWYLTPPLPAYILVILIGLERLLAQLRNAKTQRRKEAARFSGGGAFWRQGVMIAFVLLAPALLALQDWQLRPDHGLQRPAPEMAWYQLELLYRQAAESLSPDIQAAPNTPTLAAGDVGVLGYFTNARILDTVGLNSPEAIPYYPLPPAMHANAYAVAPDLIADLQPDYVVLLEVYGREGLFKDPRFLQTYRLRQKIPTGIYGSDGMLIFERSREP